MDLISPKHQKWLRVNARRLRREQTDAEKRLWSLLRSRRMGDHKFRRQLILGPYIVDFCCPEKMLIVELDGGQHAVQSGEDKQRTDDLQSRRFRVLRFWNEDVFKNTEGILMKVAAALNQSPPPHRPSGAKAPFGPPLPPASRGERINNKKRGALGG